MATNQTQQWAKKITEVHTQRNPDAMREAQRIREQAEQARSCKAAQRKCKSFSSQSRRSVALASVSLQNMSAMSAADAPAEFMAEATRWQTARSVSNMRQEARMLELEGAAQPSGRGTAAHSDCSGSRFGGLAGAGQQISLAGARAAPPASAAPVTLLRDADDDEDAADMAEAMELMNMPGSAPQAAMGDPGDFPKLLQQLKVEPGNEHECRAKFMLFEGYSADVENMLIVVNQFLREQKDVLPQNVWKDMERQAQRLHSQEAMSIPDESDEWFVYHMMQQAARNHARMTTLLEGFERKLELFANSEQTECPVCFEKFSRDGPRAAETLSCCHKVCSECWSHWTAITGHRPFCPLCRHSEFLQRVTDVGA